MTNTVRIQALAVMIVVAVLSSWAQASETRMIRSNLTYVQSAEDKLRSAASSGDLETIGRLVSRGAHINSSDIDGWTPLIAAVTSDQPDAVTLLLERGADVNAKGRKTGHTALSWAAVLGYHHLADILIAAGADLEAKNSRGRTPLMEASMRGHQATTELLLAKGANANSKDRRGRSALALAAYAGHREVVSTLIARGAESDRTAKKLMSRMGEDYRNVRRAAVDSRERGLYRLAATETTEDNGTNNVQKYTSNLDQLHSNLRAPAIRNLPGAENVPGTADLQIGNWTQSQLEELVKRGAAQRAHLAQTANSSDRQSLRRLAAQGMNLWSQIQSQYPEMATMLQGRVGTLGQILGR